MRFLFFMLFCSTAFVTNSIGQQPKLLLPIGHTRSVIAAQFVNDNKRVISNSQDGTIKLWDVKKGSLLKDLKIAKGSALIKFSKDKNKFLGFGDPSGLAVIYSSENCDEITRLKNNNEQIREASFSDDGKKILTISEKSVITLWDALKGDTIFTIQNPSNILFKKAVFSPDSKMILIYSPLKVNGTTIPVKDVGLFNTASGKLIENFRFEGLPIFAENNTKLIYTSGPLIYRYDIINNKKVSFKIGKKFDDELSLSPDGKKVIIHNSKPLKSSNEIWDVETQTMDFEIKNMYTVWYSADGKTIIGENVDGTKIFDAKNGNLLKSYLCYYCTSTRFPIDSIIIYSPDKSKSFFFTDKKSLSLFDEKSNKLIAELKTHLSPITGASFSTDGTKILTCSEDYTTKIWDANNGNLLITLKGSTFENWSADFSPNKGKLVMGSGDNTAKVWDVKHSNLIYSLNGHTDIVNSTKYSNDGSQILTASDDGTAILWNEDSRKQLFVLKHKDILGDSLPIYGAKFSPDGKKIVTIGEVVKIWDSRTGKKINNVSRFFGDVIFDAEFSPNNKGIVTSGYAGLKEKSFQISLYDISKVKFDEFLLNSQYKFWSIKFSPSGSRIVTTEQNNAIIWDLSTRKTLLTLSGHSKPVTSASYSLDGSKLITANKDEAVKIWDAENGKLLTNINQIGSKINSANFFPDGNKVLITAEDNTNKVYNSKSGHLIYTFFAVDSIDHFTILPNGYYQATPNAAKKLHYVTKDLKVINFDQLDIKYNRPDKVLEAIGSTDTTLTSSYKKAYEKRIRKLGIDTIQFKSGYSVPEADFKNRDLIENEQNKQQLSLHITGRDSTYNLDRFNVWINESPLFGMRGISLKYKATHNLDTTITVMLSDGDNRIETSITNTNGTESYRMPLYVKYQPVKLEIEKLHFIGIGINQFADNTYNLNWSVKDIRDLARSFKARYGENCTIDTLFAQSVAVKNVTALKADLLKTSVNDKVIIAYSGHGLLSKDYDYYLSTYTVNFNKPEQNGLPYDLLENLLDGIPARKKLMLVDACHSGEVDKEEMLHYSEVKDSLDNKNIKRGARLINNDSSKVGMKNSFELMQSLFVNVARSTGATIISAAGGTQFALEKSDLKNGVFTYSILEYMQTHPHTTVSELKKLVNKRVTELTNGMQVPTPRSENDVVDWKVW